MFFEIEACGNTVSDGCVLRFAHKTAHVLTALIRVGARRDCAAAAVGYDAVLHVAAAHISHKTAHARCALVVCVESCFYNDILQVVFEVIHEVACNSACVASVDKDVAAAAVYVEF